MARLDDEIEDLEDERDRTNKSLKKQIDAKEEERRSMSKIVREGNEEREIFCDKLADYNTGEIVWTDAHPPYDEVKRRKMSNEERQLPLENKAKPIPKVVDAQSVEPEDVATVTLYGEIMEQLEKETVFCVHYGDEAGTEAVITIPNEQIQMPAFGDPTSTQDMITLTRAYALEAGIIAAAAEEETYEAEAEPLPGIRDMDVEDLSEIAAAEGDAFTVDAGGVQ